MTEFHLLLHIDKFNIALEQHRVHATYENGNFLPPKVLSSVSF